jgi:electron transport complex protein RnfC
MVSWKMAEGQTNDALVIRMEGSFEKLGRPEEVFPWTDLSPSELQRCISEFGIVEMEGSGRPLSDILSAPHSTKRSLTLVVRCVFDDPWLAADYVLCRERLKAVVEGSAIIAHMARVSRIVFAFSHRERDLGALFLAEAENYGSPASLVLTGSRYPQRNRRELELVLRNYEKKEEVELGSLLVLGPATLAAVHDAVKLKKPILDRYVAVGGSAVKFPHVMKVRIGTRIGEVFAECGGFIDQPKRMATGSPLLGRTVVDLDEPVIKSSYAAFAMLGSQVGLSAPRSCISCGECRIVCPVGLDPEELFKSADGKKESVELGSLLALGPATLAAVRDAVKLKKPILDRYIAVGGSAVKNPQVMKVRIGTRIGEVFAECGGFIDRPRRIAIGSPLMGRTVADLDEPVIKPSYAVFAMLGSQIGGQAPRSCISCGECRIVCPVGLDPEELFKRAGGKKSGGKKPGSAPGVLNECHGCGCCEVVCPSRLPLSTVILDATARGR